MNQLTQLFRGFLIMAGLGLSALLVEFILSRKGFQKRQHQKDEDSQTVQNQLGPSEDEVLEGLCNELRELQQRIEEFGRNGLRFVPMAKTLDQVQTTLGTACDNLLGMKNWLTTQL